MCDRRVRLDSLLVERGLFPTRARARDAILRGTVQVNDVRAVKPGQSVSAVSRLAVDDPASAYVSRAALKLLHALDAFGLDPSGRVCLDVGASTGGFTQVLLERGAVRVHALDVGHGQLHPSLRGDARVSSLEGVNARAIPAGSIPGPVDALVADVSFISLKLALPGPLALCSADAWLALLVKPQFELGPKVLGRGGVVRDADAARSAADEVAGWITERGWTVLGVEPSPIAGGRGNREFLLGAVRDGRSTAALA